MITFKDGFFVSLRGYINMLPGWEAKTKVTIREAKKEDWVQIKDLIFRTPELMKTHLTSYRSFFVAELEGVVIACIALAILVYEDLCEEDQEKPPKAAEIRSLAVEPKFRGRGIGSMLIERCINRATERDVYECIAYTNAQELFEKFDFSTYNNWKYAMFRVLKNGNGMESAGHAEPQPALARESHLGEK